jgi:RNA polymerase sigma-70 factor (ECF subfamily)
MPLARREPAFDAVYRAHFGFVWRVLRGMGVPEASLEDAAQEVFVVVMRRLPEFDGRAPLESWLVQIALRVASNARRSLSRRPQAPLLTEPAAAGPSPAEQVDHKRALAEVLSILDALDEDSRTVLVLAQLEQMTAPEIAALLDLNVNTVSSRLRRARRAFADELSRHRMGGT